MDKNFENKNINVGNHAATPAPFAVRAEGDNLGTDIGMKSIYEKPDGTCVVAMRLKDMGTKENKYIIAVMGADGEVSPLYVFLPSKLKTDKSLDVLTDLDGITFEDIEGIHKNLMASSSTLNVQRVGESKCSPRQAYELLNEYVRRYMEVETVFIKDGYGCIEATYLQTVIDKLKLGYTGLELERNFKAWGLLRTSDKAGHYYTYKIGRKYYFTFKLADVDSTEGGGEA